METFSISEILAILYRRRRLMAITSALVLVLSLALALKWSRYHTTATIEIQQPFVSPSVAEIRSENVPASAVGLADRRISQIQQRVTSTESLNEIIAALDLYPGARKSMDPAKLAAMMRARIQLKFIGSTVANPAATHKESVEQLSAIAFTLRFDYPDAKLAKETLDVLVERFIAEEEKQRREQAAQTAAFLEQELAKQADIIKEQEAAIAQFRSEHGESGPTTILFNQQASMSSAMNLQQVESQISTVHASIGTLRGQLAATDPYLPMIEDGKTLHTPSSQMKSLKAQLATLSGRYGPKHPDVVKVKDQMAALESQGVSAAKNGVRRDADNPVYLQVAAQLSAAEAQLRALQAQRESLRQQQDKYAQAIAKNPMIEQQMSQLTLDLENAKERYRALKDKKLSAQMKQELDASANSERLRVLTPPSLPEHTSPRRMLIVLAGAFLAVISAFMAVLIAELLRPTIRGTHHLSALIGVPPLVSIPTIR